MFYMRILVGTLIMLQVLIGIGKPVSNFLNLIYFVDSPKCPLNVPSNDIYNPQANVEDSLALIALYNATNGDNWNHHDNWLVPEQPIDTWYGVTINDNGRIKTLDLFSNNLNGIIPAEIGDFAELTSLRLDSNNLVGNIPMEIGNLENLIQLLLRQNQLSGSVPTILENLTSLKRLDLNSNQLTGGIPVEISNMSSLEWLGLSNNQLTGNIPPELGNLANLTILSLRKNQLTDSIPNTIGNLTQLHSLILSDNQLTGNIPAEIGNLTALTLLSLEENQLTGSIFPEIGNLSNLTSLLLSRNQLTGSLPEEIGNLTNLEWLGIAHNQLSGSIPTSISNLTNLQYLLLHQNQLTGSIPIEIGNLVNLLNISLHQNNLTGSIPNEIGNLTNLILLTLFDNQLNGNIPPEIGNLINLTSLSLGNNQFSGNIPPEIGNLTHLTWLGLNYNHLTGDIPSELGNLTDLRWLLLHDNQLTGGIPTALGNLESLKWLQLQHNQLSGNIPPELANLENLEWLLLFDNQLTGEIPSQISTLPNLYTINLQKNHLTGSIPNLFSEYEGEIPPILHLNDNQLNSELPASLFSITAGIDSLDLSNNKLSGNLPPQLALINLHGQMSLANNQFSGCFPASYSIFCDKDVDFSGNPDLFGNGNFTVFCSNGAGICHTTLTGQVIFDQNENCIADTIENGLSFWKIKATSATQEFYALTRADGGYGLDLPVGNYTIEAIPCSYLWQENCTGTAPIIIGNPNERHHLNFFATAANCPALEVDISTTILRKYSSGVYYIEYRNLGAITAENASIKITLNDFIIVDSTSIPITGHEGNLYSFNIGNVNRGSGGRFSLYVHLSHDAILGQTLCTEAHIYPDAICADIPSEWSGASIVAKGRCNNGNVTFTISNEGEGEMETPQGFIIIEDVVLLRTDPIELQLSSGDSIVINYEGNGSTYILIADQVPHLPRKSKPLVAVEGCGTNNSGSFSMGYVTQYPEDDASPFISIDCQEIVGSWDPNDKRGFPKGYGEEHLIDLGQDIEYHIRFQNTGSDTAFNVVVKDVIAPELDMGTLQFGTSSHPYSVELIGNTLQFTFNNIMLPDSNVNEQASHGFVKFRISQKPDLELGTVINNTTSIYFDGNEPVVTNTTVHKIGANYFKFDPIKPLNFENIKIIASPNPFNQYSVITLKDVKFSKGRWSLYNISGKPIRSKKFYGNVFQITSDGLESSIYILKIYLDDLPAGTGKLIINK